MKGKMTPKIKNKMTFTSGEFSVHKKLEIEMTTLNCLSQIKIFKDRLRIVQEILFNIFFTFLSKMEIWVIS